MIPSEFNQDIMAQQRKLRMLNEARSTFKVGDRVRLRPDSEPGRRAKKDKRPIAGKITKATRLQSDSLELVVKMDDGRNSRVFATSVVKEEYITEKVGIAAVDNKTGEVFLNLAAGSSSFENSQVAEINDSVRKLTAALRSVGGGTVAVAARQLRLPASDRRFWMVKLNSVSKPADVVKWIRKVLGSSFNESVQERKQDLCEVSPNRKVTISFPNVGKRVAAMKAAVAQGWVSEKDITSFSFSDVVFTAKGSKPLGKLATLMKKFNGFVSNSQLPSGGITGRGGSSGVEPT